VKLMLEFGSAIPQIKGTLPSPKKVSARALCDYADSPWVAARASVCMCNGVFMYSRTGITEASTVIGRCGLEWNSNIHESLHQWAIALV